MCGVGYASGAAGCSSCASGYYPEFGECVRCAGGKRVVGFAVAVLVPLLLLLLSSWISSDPDDDPFTTVFTRRVCAVCCVRARARLCV